MSGVHALGWALVHFGWQGALVGGILAVLLRAARGRAATERYALCVVALVAMVLLPVGTFVRFDAGSVGHKVGSTPPPAVSSPAPSEAAEAPPAGAGAAPAATDAPRGEGPVADAADGPGVTPALRAGGRLQPVLPALVVVWWTGVVLLSARFLADWRAVRRLRRAASRPAPAACIAMVQRLAARLAIRRRIDVLESAWLQVPVVVGWLRPAVLVPASVVAGLAPRQLEMLLAHELAHVRRHDYLVNLLQAGVETLLFYHPAVWWVSRRTRAEREHCCDDIAVAVCGDARLYARTLVDLEQMRTTPALAVAASGGVLGERVRRLLGASHAQPASRGAAGAVGLVGGVGFAIALLFAPGVVPPSRGAAPTLGARQAPVAQAADASLPLPARWEWALQQARERDIDHFWIGYSIVANPELEGPIFVGHLGEGEHALHGHDMTLSGRIVHTGSHGDDGGGWRFPGARLDVPADPNAIALLFELRAGRGHPTVLHAHVASLVYPVDLAGRPYFWLGASADEPSAALVRTLDDGARGLDARVDLVGALGVHSTSAAIVPQLVDVLQSGREHDDVRSEAAEWAGRHPRAESLAALARAARADRSADVRREAAESVGAMRLAAAADTAIALARTLRDADARREAVESLGTRSDARSLAALVDLARDDPDPDIAREAAETLGERKEPAAREALRELARSHRSADVQREAVETLGESLPPEEARELLRDIALSNPSEDARREAVESLANLPGGVGLTDVRELARRHPDPEVRREAVERLGRLSAERDVLDELARIAVEDASEDVQREAVETLGQRSERQGRDMVARLAREHASVAVRREAVETLGQALPPSEAVTALTRIVADEPDPGVVREALETLSELPNGAGVEALVAIGRTHRDPEIRREALRTLIDSDDPRARALFDRALQKR